MRKPTRTLSRVRVGRVKETVSKLKNSVKLTIENSWQEVADPELYWAPIRPLRSSLDFLVGLRRSLFVLLCGRRGVAGGLLRGWAGVVPGRLGW